MPDTITSFELPGAEPVDKHPMGCSSYGVCDLVGNVWQARYIVRTHRIILYSTEWEPE